MEKQIKLLIIVTLFFSVHTDKLYSEIITMSNDQNIELENSIIIKDLNMESQEPKVDNNSPGEIIYDEDFDETIIEYKKRNNVPKNKINKPNKTSYKTSINYLKKKNIRWHLTKYKIKKNDNLWKIAKKFGISHTLLIEVNNIKNPNRLLLGNYINIPNKNGSFYIIKKGDTPTKISKKFNIHYKKILAHNNLNARYLKIGQKIFIPDAIIIKNLNKNSKKYYAKPKSVIKKKSLINFYWPLKGKITSAFGNRKDPFSGKKKFHCGIDISAKSGTKIKATSNGKVIYSGWKKGYGKVVVIRHKYGYISVYANNSKNKVKVNKSVKKGEIIAYSGQTGAVTGPHLHFEIRKYITPLNPIRLLH